MVRAWLRLHRALTTFVLHRWPLAVATVRYSPSLSGTMGLPSDIPTTWTYIHIYIYIHLYTYADIICTLHAVEKPAACKNRPKLARQSGYPVVPGYPGEFFQKPLNPKSPGVFVQSLSV